MKRSADGKKRGFFARIANAFAHNWGLKLLSLALALIIYHSLKSDKPQTANDQRRIFQY
ncbi:MAG: hypothetical protein ILO34_00630 [Kiritimatiellae bacterium]|nr:hypothetical protein [Kiritimatiellia bacterium]